MDATDRRSTGSGLPEWIGFPRRGPLAAARRRCTPGRGTRLSVELPAMSPIGSDAPPADGEPVNRAFMGETADEAYVTQAVEERRSHVMEKLDLHSVADIVLFAVRRGVIS